MVPPPRRVASNNPASPTGLPCTPKTTASQQQAVATQIAQRQGAATAQDRNKLTIERDVEVALQPSSLGYLGDPGFEIAPTDPFGDPGCDIAVR